MKIYFYNRDGIYQMASEARLSPLDLEQGRTVPLVPANATLIAPPDIPEGKQARWDGETWAIEDRPPANHIEKNVTEVEITSLTREILTEFPEAGVTLNDGLLRIDNVADTDANNISLDAILAAHDYNAAMLNVIRRERNQKLSATDWIIKRHRDQIDLGITPDLTNTQYTTWLEYQQTLRNFPAICNPHNPQWPTEPSL